MNENIKEVGLQNMIMKKVTLVCTSYLFIFIHCFNYFTFIFYFNKMLLTTVDLFVIM